MQIHTHRLTHVNVKCADRPVVQGSQNFAFRLDRKYHESDL